MRSQVARRLRSNSIPLNALPPASSSTEYSTALANLAAHILYRSPLPSQNDLPVYILNSWAFPDARTTDYDKLLPYVLARLPDDEELISGLDYEVVFFAGSGGGDGNVTQKKGRPSWGWFVQAYHVLTRATRKRLRKLYIVHGKNWIRMMVETFTTVVSPKFRKKIVHVSSLSGLTLHTPIEDLLIPPSAYLYDRRKSPDIYAPCASGQRAFGVKEPFPTSADGSPRLPRVLRETTRFVIMDENVKKEGIFRISARAQTVKLLREAYDRGQKFIVWREGEVVLASSYRKEGTGDVWVEELDQTEGYELHAAAALVKLWYKELREPIFPLSSYQALEKFYGSPEISLDPPQLLAMLSMDDEWSPISSKTSRQILTMHLLPMLSRVAEYSECNQMTPSNLAVCFAPSLLCGPDPIEDLRLSGIIRRVLVAMIVHWKNDLAPLLGTSLEKYEDSLRMPETLEDQEDPLEEMQMKDISGISEIEAQTTGITLEDNESSDDEMEGLPPPLPPRPLVSTIERVPLPVTSPVADSPSTGFSPVDVYSPNGTSPTDAGTSNGISPVRRKPAPALLPLPRYSTIVFDPPAVLPGMQYYNTVAPENDGFEEEEDAHGLPLYEEGVPDYKEPSREPPAPPSAFEPSTAESPIQRKPLPKTASRLSSQSDG